MGVERPISTPISTVFHLTYRLAWCDVLKRCTLLLNGEERAVPKPTISGIIVALNQLRRVFPPLKKLLFEAFWFVFAAVEIVRFLRSLL